MQRAGAIDEIEVGVEMRDGGQVIVVVWPVEAIGGMGLVNLLAAGKSCKLEAGRKWMRAEVQHTDEVDQRVMQLIDVLIDIRVLHPKVMQLPLELGEGEAVKLVEVLG